MFRCYLLPGLCKNECALGSKGPSWRSETTDFGAGATWGLSETTFELLGDDQEPLNLKNCVV